MELFIAADKGVVLSCSRVQWLAPLNPAALFRTAGMCRGEALMYQGCPAARAHMYIRFRQ